MRGGAIFAPLIAASILFAATTANAADKPIAVGASISQTGPVCTENLNADIMVMKSAKDWV